MDDEGEVKERTLNLSRLNERLPYFTKASGKTVQATDISLLTTSEISTVNDIPEGFKLTIGEGDTAIINPFGIGADTGDFHELVIREIEVPIRDWVLTRPASPNSLDKAWLVVRYVLAQIPE